jgi:hypothetical protein
MESSKKFPESSWSLVPILSMDRINVFSNSSLLLLHFPPLF